MAYSQDFRVAARRHLRAASLLFNTMSAGLQPGCKAVAGYLFGISGELAIKEIMRTSGMKPLPAQDRRDDPFYAHFPVLKTLLRDTAWGRRAGELARFAQDDRLFQNWDTDMRYSATSSIRETWVEDWKASAEALVERINIA